MKYFKKMYSEMTLGVCRELVTALVARKREELATTYPSHPFRWNGLYERLVLCEKTAILLDVSIEDHGPDFLLIDSPYCKEEDAKNMFVILFDLDNTSDCTA